MPLPWERDWSQQGQQNQSPPPWERDWSQPAEAPPASIAAPQQQAPQTGPSGPRFSDTGFWGGVNQGIADLIGAPVDLASAGLGAVGVDVGEAPFGGSESIRRGMQSADIAIPEQGQRPEGMAGETGYGVGSGVAAVLPFGYAARLLQTGGPVAAGTGQALMRPFVETPIRAGAAEIAAGAGAGAGGRIGEQAGGQYGRIAGELLGGAVGAAGPVGAISGAAKIAERTPVAGLAMRGARRATFPFTAEGSRQRASERVRGLAADPERAAQRIEQGGIGDLTPSQRTGEPGLMALEKSVLETDRALGEQFKDQTAQASRQLRDALRQPAAGASLDATRESIRRRRDYLTNLMDQRITQANETVQQRLANLNPQMRTAQSSAIAREEIDKALQAARAQERQIWSEVPQDAEVPTTAARERFIVVEEQTPRAQRDRIPEIARRFLSPTSNERLKPVETVKELRGVYSELRETSREARATGDWNQARISDDLADAVLDDLGANANPQTTVGQALSNARAFSRDLNERFSRGTVGRILGYDRAGGVSTPPETTLDVTVGRGGNQAAVALDDIRRAVETNPQQAEAAIQDYVTRRFSEYALRGNEFSPDRAAQFVRQNQELLQRFPELQARMQNAEQAQRLASQTQRRLEGRAKALVDPAQSRAAEFLGAPIDREFERMLRPSQRNPAEMARSLRAMASKDKTGEALRGLKGGFYDYLVRQSRTGDADEAGEFLLSGRRMMNLLADRRTRAAAQEILTNQEMERLTTISRELANLEAASKAAPLPGGVIQDAPSRVLSTVAGVVGADIGRRMGTGTIQTPGIMAGRARQIANFLTRDRAHVLIREAITKDPELYKALLTGTDSPRQYERAQRRIVAWIESQTGQQFKEDENAPQR